MKRIAVFLFVLFLIPFTAFGYQASGQVVANSGFATGIADLADIDEYGGVTLHNLTVADFQKAGFEYADLVSVTIADKTLEMPVVSNYRCAVSGAMMLIMPSNPKRKISFQAAYSDFANANKLAKKITSHDKAIKWVPVKGIKYPMNVTITMSKKQGYKKEYEYYNLIRTYKREDYKHLTDEEFANFREVKAKNIGSKKLYRASTPINSRLARNYYVDRMCKEAGIKTFFNLCDTEADAKTLPAFKKSYYATQNIYYLALNVDITSDTFSNGMKEIVKGMLNPKAFPCLIHCVEGQDRTGFACAVLELFMGADYETVEADYVKTFMNYYGVKEGTEQYKTIAKNIYLNLDRAFKARIKGYKGFDMKQTQQLAKDYLKSLGYKDEQLNQLWDNLSK